MGGEDPEVAVMALAGVGLRYVRNAILGQLVGQEVQGRTTLLDPEPNEALIDRIGMFDQLRIHVFVLGRVLD